MLLYSTTSGGSADAHTHNNTRRREEDSGVPKKCNGTQNRITVGVGGGLEILATAHRSARR